MLNSFLTKLINVVFTIMGDKYSAKRLLMKETSVKCFLLKYFILILFIMAIWLFDFLTKMQCMLLFMITSVTFDFINFNIPIPEYEILKILCKSKLGPGYFAAYSYFTGYLEKVLVVSEFPGRPSLIDRMKEYESENDEGIKLPIKKLLILLPLSGRTETQIGRDSEMIEMRKSLNQLGLKRAGTERIYNNSVYELFLGEKVGNARGSVSIVAEYATGLPTIMELCQKFPSTYLGLKEIMIETYYDGLINLKKERPDCGKYFEIFKFDDNVEHGVEVLQKYVKTVIKENPELFVSSPRY